MEQLTYKIVCNTCSKLIRVDELTYNRLSMTKEVLQCARCKSRKSAQQRQEEHKKQYLT